MRLWRADQYCAAASGPHDLLRMVRCLLQAAFLQKYDKNQFNSALIIVRTPDSWHPRFHQNMVERTGMPNTLKTLVEELVNGGDLQVPAEVLPTPEAVELDSEEAWNDFQDSQIAFEKSFQDSTSGAI
jgi:hypothetical protein